MDFEELKDWISYVHSPYYPPSNNLSIELFVQSIGKEPRPDFKFERQIAVFEGYLHTLESYLEQEIQRVKDEAEEIRAKVAKEFDKLREEVKAGRISSDPEIISRYEHDILVRWEDPSIYEHYRLEEIGEFADTLRKSFFINLYGFWESQLFPLCKSLKNYNDTIPSPNPKNAYPSKAINFFERINFPTGSEPKTNWDIIYDYYRPLRNCLAHNNGELSRCSSPGKIESFILTEKPALSIEGQIVVINKGFCEESLETITQFFKDLLDALTQWALPQTTS